MNFKKLKQEPLFQLGLLIKVLLIVFLVPQTQEKWFVPFIINWIENPLNLPWSSYILSGGSSLAFPYGPIMFIFHLPTTFIGWCFDLFFEVNSSA